MRTIPMSTTGTYTECSAVRTSYVSHASFDGVGGSLSVRSPDSAHWWMPLGGCLLLAAASWVSARSTGRSMIEFFAVGVVMAVVTGGVTYALSQWFAQFISVPASV